MTGNVNGVTISINWNRAAVPSEQPRAMPTGFYRARVTWAEHVPLKGGKGYAFHIKMRAVDIDRHLCDDFLVTSGRGDWYTPPKLRALGLTEGGVCAGDLIGREAYVAVLRMRMGRNRVVLNVDTQEGAFGYRAIGDPPAVLATVGPF